jgi:hypothetical protein
MAKPLVRLIDVVGGDLRVLKLGPRAPELKFVLRAIWVSRHAALVLGAVFFGEANPPTHGGLRRLGVGRKGSPLSHAR